MSTTRWIIYFCGLHHRYSDVSATYCDIEHTKAAWQPEHQCRMSERIVVDPDNLPPEAIQRAAEAVFGVRSGNRWDSVTETTRVGYRKAAEAAVRAFLSDPEPGDQTLACWAKAPNHIHDSECGVRS